ncbi:MAG: glycerophosphodiester phosphodiesterase family protein [Pseudomonadota bacterium]
MPPVDTPAQVTTTALSFLPPRIVAHRGASVAAPENTFAALRRAAGMGARWVEVDASLLGCGTAVLHHDATLGRTSSGDRPLLALSAADLAGIDAGAWHSEAHAGEPIPTLAAALDLVAALGLGLNLELKTHGADPGPLARAAAAALNARPALANKVLVSSFDHAALVEMQRIAPAYPRAPIWHGPPADWATTARQLDAVALHAGADEITPDQIAEATALGLPTRVFTVNDTEEAARLRRMGVAAFFTDVPEHFLADPNWVAWDAT